MLEIESIESRDRFQLWLSARSILSLATLEMITWPRFCQIYLEDRRNQWNRQASHEYWKKSRSPFENDTSDLVILLRCGRFQIGPNGRSSVPKARKIDQYSMIFFNDACNFSKLAEASVTIEILGVWFCYSASLRSISKLAEGSVQWTNFYENWL